MDAEPTNINVIGAIDRKGHMDSFKLKVLAIIGMTANHVAHVLGSSLPWQVTLILYCFGGMTYATMAFLMVEGYLHTSNLRKYALRLFIFALVSQVPFSLCFGWHANVLFTLLLGLGLLWAWDNVAKSPDWTRAIGGVLFALILLVATAISHFCDWAYVGPAMVWLFYALRNKGTLGILITMAVPYAYTLFIALSSIIPAIDPALSQGAVMVERGVADAYRVLYLVGVPILLSGALLQGIANLGYAIVGFTIATVCICHYNGERGRPMKWFFYAYYPAHLLIIWGIARLLEVL